MAIAGAVVFAGYIGYLAWVNESFPVEERPFADYAAMAVPPQFNGTDISFHVRWMNADYLPIKAQVTSPASSAANTPTCFLDLQAVGPGQVIPMPFGISTATPVLTNVQLSIDVKTLATGHEFTIIYTVDYINATAGNVTPTNISCQQSGSVM